MHNRGNGSEKLDHQLRFMQFANALNFVNNIKKSI